MGRDMIVGLDARMWGHPGIGRYMRELAHELFLLDKKIQFSVLAYEKDLRVLQQSYPSVVGMLAQSKIYSVREQEELTRFSKTVDILHSPHFNIPWICRAKLVCTVHDLIYLKEARFSGSRLKKIMASLFFKRIEKKADAVIAVSDFTKKDLIGSYPRLNGKIHVIGEAASARFKPASELEKKELSTQLHLKRPYVLFVGSLRAHKNISALLEAFKQMKAENPEILHELLLAGKMAPKEKQLSRQIRLEEAAGVRYLGLVSDALLPALYSQAEALVVPSLWEGFGLTLLEGMACGTPVLSSNRASLPEVGGDAVLYFDPQNVDELKQALAKVLTQDALRKSLSARGLARAKQFSWKKAAEDTIRVYREVAQ